MAASSSSTNEQVETYGAHFLVDYKPIQEADELLAECEQYIEDSRAEIYTLPFSTFSRVAANLKAWRTKRKDTKLLTIYQQLQPRILMVEKNLRGVIGEVVEKKGILRLQAKHLQTRLEKCVDYNQALLQASEGPLEDTRNFVNTLSSESTILKEMMNFNSEILRLKKLEEHTKNLSVMRWGKPRNNRQVPEPELSKDDDHNSLEARLLTFRDVSFHLSLNIVSDLIPSITYVQLREKFVGYLAYLLEKRGIQQSNLDNCMWSLDAIKSAVKREGVASTSSSENDETQERNSFDHARCTDCSFGYSMSCDCMSHLAALQKQAQDANRRLQMLVEVRERMLEAAEILSRTMNEDMPPSSPDQPTPAES
jgi:hypothetical protein